MLSQRFAEFEKINLSILYSSSSVLDIFGGLLNKENSASLAECCHATVFIHFELSDGNKYFVSQMMKGQNINLLTK